MKSYRYMSMFWLLTYLLTATKEWFEFLWDCFVFCFLFCYSFKLIQWTFQLIGCENRPRFSGIIDRNPRVASSSISQRWIFIPYLLSVPMELEITFLFFSFFSIFVRIYFLLVPIDVEFRTFITENFYLGR